MLNPFLGADPLVLGVAEIFLDYSWVRFIDDTQEVVLVFSATDDLTIHCCIKNIVKALMTLECFLDIYDPSETEIFANEKALKDINALGIWKVLISDYDCHKNVYENAENIRLRLRGIKKTKFVLLRIIHIEYRTHTPMIIF